MDTRKQLINELFYDVIITNKGEEIEFLGKLSSVEDQTFRPFLREFLQVTLGFDKVKILTWLFQQGADINYQAEGAGTPLAAAVFMNDVAMINFLIDHGAHVNQPVANFSRSTGYTPLHVAARDGHNEAVIALLNAHANINEPLCNNDHSDPYGIFGETPLHFACDTGYSNVVETLIQNKADINAVDLFGLTPLHHAAAKGFSDITQKLLLANANPNAKDLSDMSVLQALITHRVPGLPQPNPTRKIDHVDVLQQLLKAGVEVTEKDVNIAAEQIKKLTKEISEWQEMTKRTYQSEDEDTYTLEKVRERKIAQQLFDVLSSKKKIELPSSRQETKTPLIESSVFSPKVKTKISEDKHHHHIPKLH